MKRKGSPTKPEAASKKAKIQVPDYHLTPQVKEEDGSIQWPAPKAQMERAREIIQECAAAKAKTLIVPDKDADGLSSGAILRHTLLLLGLPEDHIAVHLLTKGNTIHTESERQLMAAHNPSFIFVLDQGSRAGPPVIDTPTTTSLIIDHHHCSPTSFPSNSTHVTASASPPVATSSLLTYLLCLPLHPSIPETCAWLCLLGTYGDLGATIKWLPPFPDLSPHLKLHKKKILTDAVALINAPRRTATYDVRSAWDALATTPSPSTILSNPRLRAAQAEVSAEISRCTHTPPAFSADGKVALFRIRSAAQVHPVIATRWAGHLSSKALEIVMVANEGYLDGKVNFSCRVARCARGREEGVDIIERLRAYAGMSAPADSGGGDDVVGGGEEGGKRPPLIERLGDDFARGHVQASGGVVGVEAFEELVRVMRIGVKPAKKEGGEDGSSLAKMKKKGGAIDIGQKNNLMNYFGKAEKGV